ncbi:glycosyltransferase family 2 protein [Achromobacter sp. NFACC18-2]|uniref:glycosyltransferase n=1 Tax=Achromobacter sp. NFACC18-2 TaxID=1564112 RepID=UPI0008B8A49B|nr:glycosyltransferase family 2 protein [Achromobacter sp. NFACC18-2]SEK11231.1 Glycosyl transferase family 2 [Achromobacter sp. NFACC18-2]
MIGVCIPAHNEERHIQDCLRAVTRAARHRRLGREAVKIVVVLDHCMDRTAPFAAAWPVDCVAIQARNVGMARAAGAQHLLRAGARWLAFTDADSRVSPAWLADQLSLDAEVVCGTVSVTGWEAHGALAQRAQRAFVRHYQDCDGHRHVHGANLGVAAQAYRRIGGFAALACSEDQALVDRLEQGGARIAWSCLPRVTTSARPHSRVEGGFASALRKGRDERAAGPGVQPERVADGRAPSRHCL